MLPKVTAEAKAGTVLVILHDVEAGHFSKRKLTRL